MISELMLKIESDEYEVECKRCNSTGLIERPYPGCLMSDDPTSECYDCEGTGTRKVKLVGMVEFKMKYDYKLQQYKVRLLDWIADPCEFCVLAEKVTQAYRDGTLPDSIRDFLKEVSV